MDRGRHARSVPLDRAFSAPAVGRHPCRGPLAAALASGSAGHMSGIAAVLANDSARYSLFWACWNRLTIPEGWRQEALIGGDWCGARNTLCQMTLDSDAEYLWFMDDDHAFSPDILTRLLAHQKDLVVPGVLHALRSLPSGGLHRARRGRPLPARVPAGDAERGSGAAGGRRDGGDAHPPLGDRGASTARTGSSTARPPRTSSSATRPSTRASICTATSGHAWATSRQRSWSLRTWTESGRWGRGSGPTAR